MSVSFALDVTQTFANLIPPAAADTTLAVSYVILFLALNALARSQRLIGLVAGGVSLAAIWAIHLIPTSSQANTEARPLVFAILRGLPHAVGWLGNLPDVKQWQWGVLIILLSVCLLTLSLLSLHRSPGRFIFSRQYFLGLAGSAALICVAGLLLLLFTPGWRQDAYQYLLTI
jgi:hypothetical protein